MRDLKATQLYATDGDVYDVIMASSRRMSSNVLLEMISERRIFCSPHAQREELADYTSGLIHDHYDIARLIQKGEYNRNAERTTFVDLDVELSSDDIKSAVIEYQRQVGLSEKITTPISTINKTRVNLEYDEIDHSRTKLFQKQQRQADFSFDVSDGRTRVRRPATDKARVVFLKLKSIIDTARASASNIEEISVSEFITSGDRTEFFMRMMKSVLGYQGQLVTDARVARWTDDQGQAFSDHDTNDENDVETQAARQRIISIVNSVSMRGVNITATDEYQKLLEKGFFLTSLTWMSEQQAEPRDKVQFEVAFENGVEGTGFRYAVRYSPRRSAGDYSKSFQSVPETRKPVLCKLIEETARAVLTSMREAARPMPSTGDAGGK
ncbi:hypothetical protein FHR71_001543 [Methylobacterium sp. RAS18]|nr:hypothetical protein [Methylobacterium sp. RAS18]